MSDEQHISTWRVINLKHINLCGSTMLTYLQGRNGYLVIATVRDLQWEHHADLLART